MSKSSLARNRAKLHGQKRHRRNRATRRTLKHIASIAAHVHPDVICPTHGGESYVIGGPWRACERGGGHIWEGKNSLIQMVRRDPTPPFVLEAMVKLKELVFGVDSPARIPREGDEP